MSHICPSVPMGSDCTIYVEACECGHECGVETNSGRRLRHEFAGGNTKERAESHARWLTGILKQYCRVGEISFDIRD